jgi:hypothetical protein
MKIFRLIVKCIIATLIFVMISLNGCFNPFAPRIDNSNSNNNILADQKTIDGVFQNFKYAYTFKDTTIYGQLLTEDFIFTYYDYNLGIQVSWDRPTDMRTTEGLFVNTQDLNLIWNNIINQTGDSLNVSVKRSFNLTITFNPNDILNFYGFADMTMTRPTGKDIWKIKLWNDETNP